LGAALTWLLVLLPLLPPLTPLAVCSLALLEVPMAVAVAPLHPFTCFAKFESLV
jgi:hypothetical protein